MRSLRPLFCVLISVFLFSVCHGQEDFRTWSSKGSSHEVEAAFVKVEGGIVFLKSRDGEQIEAELSKLSDADNEYVRKKSGKAIDSDSFSTTRDDSAPTRTKALISKATEIDFSLADSWNVEPDRFVESVHVDTNRISLGNKMMLSGDLLVSPDRSTMFAFYQGDSGKKVVQKLDLISGEKIGEPLEIPRSVGLDVSPDKNLFMAVSSMRMSFGNDTVNIVHHGAKLHPLVAFQPYGQKGNLSYAQFVNDNHFVTVSAEGLLGLWNINKLKLLWKAQITPGSRPALSPNRQLLFAHVNGTHLVALTALTGEVLGKQACPLKGLTQLAANDSCTTLVGVGMGTCRQWDLSTGRIVADFAISAFIRDADVKFVNDDQFLVCPTRTRRGTRSLFDLVDLNLQCSTWVYAFHTTPAVGLNGKLWYAPKKGFKSLEPELMCEIVPHPAANAAIQSASVPATSKFEAGSTLMFDITSNGAKWNQAAIEENAKKFAAEFGFDLALKSSDPVFSVDLSNPVRERDGNIYEDVSLVDMVLRSNGQIIWRPDRTKEFYEQDPTDRVSIFDDPWRGLVLPRTFRFFKPVLDGSHPVQNGFEPLTYERKYDKGFSERSTTGNGKLPDRKQPPGVRRSRRGR